MGLGYSLNYEIDFFSLVSVFLDPQVPYLEDPNTGAKMFESADIVEYVRKTYAIGQA